MRKRRASIEECRAYKILFLIREEDKKAYIEVSFSNDPVAVLRKHWRGEVDETREMFSKNVHGAKPVMWVWDAGRIPRKKAFSYLREWEQIFLTEGYGVIGGNGLSASADKTSKLSETDLSKLWNASVSELLNGSICKTVECGQEGGKKRSPTQKFTTEPAEVNLRIWAKSSTAERFRLFCDEKGLTQNQGLELLMAEHTGNISPMIRDLQNRLEKANQELEDKDRKIDRLRDALKKSEEGKEYPKAYQAAELQNSLLKEFLLGLPLIQKPPHMMIKRYSNRMGKKVFPLGKQYVFPKEQGIIRMCVEHMQYSRGHKACLFIFGQDKLGNKIRIRWFPEKKIKFGESMWESPYLWVNSPWILAVRKDGEAMELVGSLPDFREIWKIEKTEKKEPYRFIDLPEDLTLNDCDIVHEEEILQEYDDEDADEATDNWLDRKIQEAENRKLQREKW